MNLSQFLCRLMIISGGLVLLVAVGCDSESAPATAPPPETSVSETVQPFSSPGNADTESPNAADEEHAHQTGSHGGMIIPIGSDSYHADATPIDLEAVPQEGDAQEKTSQFMGQIPEELRGRQLVVTIPNLRIGDERFRVGFTTVIETHTDEMPANLPDAEERTLYLTAGGKYSEADIQANGHVTASQKFKGIASAHNMSPKPGDRICPITETKANVDFTWIVDGKQYQFCCPPCVDEFVRLAKEHPDELKDPDSYVKSPSATKDSGSDQK